MGTSNNNNAKIIYLQNPESLKMYVTHFLHNKVLAKCKCYRRTWCKNIEGKIAGKFLQKFFEYKFEKAIQNIPVYKDDFIYH